MALGKQRGCELQVARAHRRGHDALVGLVRLQGDRKDDDAAPGARVPFCVRGRGGHVAREVARAAAARVQPRLEDGFHVRVRGAVLYVRTRGKEKRR